MRLMMPSPGGSETNHGTRRGVSDSDRRSLDGLIHLLNKHEHDIENDIKFAASDVGRLIAEAATTGNASPARAKAQDVFNEISRNMKALLDVSVHLLGSAKQGVNDIVLKAKEVRCAPQSTSLLSLP